MKYIIAFCIFLSSAILFYFPMEWLFISWTEHPYYKQGFAVLILAGINAYWRQKKEEEAFGENFIWLALLALSSSFYALGTYTGLIFLQAYALFFTLLSLVFLFGDHLASKKLIAPSLLALIAIPLPFIPELTAFLQIAIVKMSTATMQLMGLAIESSAARIIFPHGEALVGEPSSGIQSLIALVNLAIVLAVWTEKMNLKKKVFFSISSIFIAIFGNYLRVLSFSLVGYFWDLDIAYDLWHDKGNLLFWTITVCILLGLFIFLNQEKVKGIKNEKE